MAEAIAEVTEVVGATVDLSAVLTEVLAAVAEVVVGAIVVAAAEVEGASKWAVGTVRPPWP